MIAIIDYGLGNIQAFATIYKRLNITVSVATSYDELYNADKIILPGVGAFDWAITKLNESGMRQTLDKLVLEKKVPVLGICVGMQIMACSSEEGTCNGLGWINAEVNKFDISNPDQTIRLPHMGWNEVIPNEFDSLFKDFENNALFYFLHSYYFSPVNKNDCIASTDYNGLFVSSVRHENIFGVQFHPEKSHLSGIKLLENFASL